MTDYKHQGVQKYQAESGVLTKGPQQSALYANQTLHPTKVMQDNALLHGERKRLQEMSILCGSHMAMRHVVEAQILGSVKRTSGHKSSMFGLQHHLGRYYELDVMDILNDPNSTPDLDKVGQRARLEEQMGI